MKFYIGLLLFSAFFVNSVSCFDGFKNKHRDNNQFDENDFDSEGLFHRKLTETRNKTYFSFESHELNKENTNNNKIGFKFQKTGEGIEINFNAIKIVTQTEYVRMVFRKLVYNNDVIRLKELTYNDMNCTTQNNFSSCLIQSSDNLFGVKVDYGTQPFIKQFGNYSKKVYPTSIKITAYIDTTSFNFNTNDNITLVVRFKSDNRKYFNHTEKEENNLYSNGTYSYVNFEEYALDQDENMLTVNISTEPEERYDDDFEQDEHNEHNTRRDKSDEYEEANKELQFVFNVNQNTNQIVWDPSVGVTESFQSSSSTTESSSSNNNLKYLGFISIGVVFIVGGAFFAYRRSHRSVST